MLLRSLVGLLISILHCAGFIVSPIRLLIRPLSCQEGDDRTVQADITGILSNLLSKEIQAVNQGSTTTPDPSLLLENAYLLSKGRLYESCMRDLVGQCGTAQEVKAAERLDTYLRGFILSERKSRARLKLNYIMAGAASNRLDQAVVLLAESDEIDDDLLAHVDALVKKEMIRSIGPAYDAEDKSEEDKLDSVGKYAVDVLRMVKRRLQVELQSEGQPDVKLLGLCLNERRVEAIEEMVCSLASVERIEQFDAFIASGISYLLEDLAGPAEDKSEARLKQEASKGVTLARMRDVKGIVERVLQRLETGLADSSDIFSTDADDYTARSK